MKQKEEKNQFNDPATSASDRLMDSLLNNVAANRQGEADENFLAKVEMELDASSPEIVESTGKSRAKRKSSGWMLGSGIAAALAVGVSVGIVMNSEKGESLESAFDYAAVEPEVQGTNISGRENGDGSSSTADQQLEQIANVERDLLATVVADEDEKLGRLEYDSGVVGKDLTDAWFKSKEINLAVTNVLPDNDGEDADGLVGSIPSPSIDYSTTVSEVESDEVAPTRYVGKIAEADPIRGLPGNIATGWDMPIPAPTNEQPSAAGGKLSGPAEAPVVPVPNSSKSPSQDFAYVDAIPTDASYRRENDASVEGSVRFGTDRRSIDARQDGSELTLTRKSKTKEKLFRVGRELIDGEANFDASRDIGRHSTAPQLLDNPWKSPLGEPLSTFSIDVDTASWTNVRGMLQRGIQLDQIPQDSVRVEEMINYFDWKYPQPEGDQPFGFAVESATSPWDANTKLLRVAIQGKDVVRTERPAANLVYLLDVSGSMSQPNKLPLVQKSIELLIEEMNADDCISIVVYAGAEGVALHPTAGNEQAEILDALKRLKAGGSTNGGAGISLAYKMAAENFKKDGINRVILCTDGDFNVGLKGTESLTQMVERKAKRDRVFLSVCGFGSDNLNDSMLESITNKGNGTYYFIDTMAEARKVFLKDMMATLVTIAKDVKIQVEFNPGQVKAYRLIGYANRRLAAEDFEDDRVDAGEIGAGHSVTAFYEIVPVDSERDPMREVTSNLRYQRPAQPEPAPKLDREVIKSPELALLKLRYKEPNGDVSKLIEQPLMPNRQNWKNASEDYRFGSAVALFGMKLRRHESVRKVKLAEIIELAEGAIGNDPHGYRAEFVKLLKEAK